MISQVSLQSQLVMYLATYLVISQDRIGFLALGFRPPRVKVLRVIYQHAWVDCRRESQLATLLRLLLDTNTACSR